MQSLIMTISLREVILKQIWGASTRGIQQAKECRKIGKLTMFSWLTGMRAYVTKKTNAGFRLCREVVWMSSDGTPQGLVVGR